MDKVCVIEYLTESGSKFGQDELFYHKNYMIVYVIVLRSCHQLNGFLKMLAVVCYLHPLALLIFQVKVVR